MATIINSTKTRNQPMPYQCEICGNCNAIKKEDRDITDGTNNKCFALKVWANNNQSRIEEYAPFTNSKRKIELTCKNFSHMKSLKMW